MASWCVQYVKRYRMMVETIVRQYIAARDMVKQAEASFANIKTQLNSAMDDYFANALNGDKKRAVFDNINGKTVYVTKTERVAIEWDTDKLKKRLPKKARDAVFKKRYIITDYRGLVKYLKSIGASPEVFKLYVAAEETFDESAIEKLSDIGAIGVDNIKGCYKVNCPKARYTVITKRS